MKLTRRRLFTLFAAACTASTGFLARRPADFVWTGTALGADAEIRIAGMDERNAAAVTRLVKQEVQRLEGAFSLYRPDSELSRLNRDGSLAGPSQDFRLLLETSLGFWEKTGGAFNPAIQPVWMHLARHFESSASAPDGKTLQEVLRRCDPSALLSNAERVALRPGMALTFNGIAQGYITDAAARILESRGLRNILIGLGETYALPGRSWRAGIAGSNTIIDLSQRALAQSAGRGTLFTPDGRWHHLIDPRTGTSANYSRAITIAASSATAADALSTALCVTPVEQHAGILKLFPSMELYRQA